MTVLSILIPTIPERVEMFTRVFNEVHRQIQYCHTVHPSLGSVEVLVDDSKKFLDGGLSIGKKREALVQRASGKYLCFLDDDDWISPDYIETLVRMCNEDKDVCTFNSFSTLDNYWMVVCMSLFAEGNQQAKPGFVYRKPWHICPVRSYYAKINPIFPDSNYGEDWGWFEQVVKLCRTESTTSQILHQYHHGKHSEADKITQHEQPELGRENNT
jgi:hypothetical protein